jgi:hypothetical protein
MLTLLVLLMLIGMVISVWVFMIIDTFFEMARYIIQKIRSV